MINFGILGLGKIAHKFAQDILITEGVKLYAVGSRSMKKATAFAKAYSATNHYDSYEQVLQDEQVDVIYIATPHVYHYSLAMKCLKAGKAVLVEKPFAMKESEVATMIEEAHKRNLFLMEALWSRFIPAFIKTRELIEKGVIGDVKLIEAKFAFTAPMDDKNRLTDAALGGGSLLDIGIYPIYLSLFLLGKPLELQAQGILAEGTDRQVSVNLKYKDSMAVLYSSFDHKAPITATIYGSDGVLRMHEAFHECRKISVTNGNNEDEVFEIPYMGNGYVHEIMEVRDCLNNNQIQSNKMSWNDSLNLIQLLDEVRNKINLTYES
ncbi:MAG: Gfo/Idh/MocA family oxidoreductase [Nonlabens sp.]